MEDFVTFELAKKLKEKGFGKPCVAFYNSGKVITWFYEPFMVKNFDTTALGNECVLAPTISQVLKWLREKHFVHIETKITEKGWQSQLIYYRWQDEIEEVPTDTFYDTYEESVLEVIEYALNHWV